MHIKQVTISGFRSFRNQTDEEVKVFSPKHNVIVGRNGSGKSNFFNAIQFVLVAPRFATLSQEDRQHILHEGAGSSVLNAYVEIVFDNSDGRLPVESDEVILRRTIGQKKDEFFLNRKKIQKNEVISLLESAGFSKSNPYYIVQQGKVANLCVMKDRDRLNLLKEIAGTSLYEEKRVESIKIMSETLNKQERINEVISYIEERLDELKKEKEELIEFDQSDKKRRCLEYTIYDNELQKIQSELEYIETNRLNETQKQLSIISDIRKQQDEIISVEENLTSLYNDLTHLEKRKENRQKEEKDIVNKRTSIFLELQEIENSQQENELNFLELQKQHNDIEKEIQVKENELEQVDGKYKEVSERLSEKQKEFITSRSRIETLLGKQGRGQQFQTEQERNEFLQNQITSLNQQIDNKTLLIQRNNAEINDLTNNLNEQKNQNDLIQQETQNLSSQINEFENKSREYLDQRNNLQEERKGTWKQLENIQDELQSCTNELEKYKQILNSSLPRNITVGLSYLDKIIEEKGISRSLSSNNGRGVYLGPVIDNIRLKHENFQTAVEVTGGNSLFHVIVDSDATASILIKELEKKKAGRLSFLPLNQLRIDTINYPDTQEVKPLIDVAIEYDPRIDVAIRQIFGKKLLAKNLDVAAKYSRECQLDAVTLDGDLVNRKGGFEGGYHDQRNSKILSVLKIRSYTSTLSKLHQQEVELNKRSEEIDNSVNDVLRDMQRMETEKNHMKSNYSQINRELATRKKQYELGLENIKKKQNAIRIINEEIITLHTQITEYQAEMNTRLNIALSNIERDELTHLTARNQILEREIIETESEVVKISTQRESIKATLKDNLKKRKSEIEISLSEIDGSNEVSTKFLSPAKNRLSMDLQVLDNNIIEFQDEFNTLDIRIAEIKNKIEETEKTFDSLKKDEIKLEGERLQIIQKLDKLLNQRNLYLDSRQEKRSLIRELGTISKKELEEYQKLSEAKLLAKLKEVNEKLKSVSGVNRRALEQYVSFNEQRESLIQRKTELIEEKKSIEHLIDSLDLQKEETIYDTFQAVSQHFSDVFQELVRGGKGELVMITANNEDAEDDDNDDNFGNLEEKNDIKGSKYKKKTVSAYRGVQVKVSFSESSQQFEMNQLSGGQKALVALALIFAIQRCDPAPFYLFDEIDQALDSNYRTEVARLISKQTNSENNPAQFITTTFRPEMVACSNQCYGIALQNKSSRIYSISKNEAQQFVTELMTEEENVTNHPVNDRQSIDTFATDRFAHDDDGHEKKSNKNKNNLDDDDDDDEVEDDENNSYLDDNDDDNDDDEEEEDDNESSVKKRRKSSTSTLSTVTPPSSKGKGKGVIGIGKKGSVIFSPTKTKKSSTQLTKEFDNVSISSYDDDGAIETKNPKNKRSTRRVK